MKDMDMIASGLQEELTLKLRKNKKYKNNEVQFFTSLKKLDEILKGNTEAEEELKKLVFLSLENENISNEFICKQSLIYGVSFCNRMRQFNTTYL